MQIKEKNTRSRFSFWSRLIKITVSFCFLINGFSLQAQCAMCRAALESSGDTAKGEAINDGIVYLMAIPYILVGVIGIFIYNMYIKKPKTV